MCFIIYKNRHMCEIWSDGNIMLVDSSYCSFYRYYATILWYKRAVHMLKLITNMNGIKTRFLDKYEKFI